MKPDPVPPPNEWKMRKPWWQDSIVKLLLILGQPSLNLVHLKASAVVRQLPDPVQNEVNDLLFSVSEVQLVRFIIQDKTIPLVFLRFKFDSKSDQRTHHRFQVIWCLAYLGSLPVWCHLA